MAIICLVYTEYLTQTHIPSSKEGKWSRWNICEISAKVLGKFYSQSHDQLFPAKEGGGGIDCCSAEGLPSNWHANQWSNWVETAFLIFQMISSLEGLQGYQWSGSGFRMVLTTVWKPPDLSLLCQFSSTEAGTFDWEHVQEGRWMIWQQLCRKRSENHRRQEEHESALCKKGKHHTGMYK